MVCSSIRFGLVTNRAKQVIIVASGPSAERLNPVLLFGAANAGVHIIAVNTSITWLPACHSWFTLDPGPRNRWLMTHQRPGVTYYAAVPDDYGRGDAKCLHHRGQPETDIHWLRRMQGRHGLCISKDSIHSGNSAWGALGLAWHMAPQDIVLIGVDGSSDGYAYVDGKPSRSLRHLPALFASCVGQMTQRGITVVNGSPDSAVDCFARMDPNKAVEWITGRASKTAAESSIQPESRQAEKPNRQQVLRALGRQQKQQLHSQKVHANANGTDSRQRRLRAQRRRRGVTSVLA